MIMTNEQMLESVGVLAQCEEKGVLGYAIARNRQKLLDEIQDYARLRDQLLAEHGTDVGGGKYRVTPQHADQFFKALQPYSMLTVDVPIMQVEPEIFYGGNLNSSQMFVLSWMCKADIGSGEAVTKGDGSA